MVRVTINMKISLTDLRSSSNKSNLRNKKNLNNKQLNQAQAALDMTTCKGTKKRRTRSIPTICMRSLNRKKT